MTLLPQNRSLKRLSKPTRKSSFFVSPIGFPCHLGRWTAQTAVFQGFGANETVYHGHGGPSDRVKTDAVRFFQRVDSVVGRVLRGQRAPLVLACVGYLAPLYEVANSFRHLVKGTVPGNPDRWNEDELREHAWTIVEPYF